MSCPSSQHSLCDLISLLSTEQDLCNLEAILQASARTLTGDDISVDATNCVQPLVSDGLLELWCWIAGGLLLDQAMALQYHCWRSAHCRCQFACTKLCFQHFHERSTVPKVLSARKSSRKCYSIPIPM